MKKPQANALEGPSYMGYCIDILEKLQEHIDFKYHLYLVPDGQYGSRDPVSQQWDGIMREIIEQVMSVASMADIEHIEWRHNERDGVSNHQLLDCLFNSLFRRRWKKTPKLRVTGHCVGNSPVTGGFPSQKPSNAENVSIWWYHHEGLFQHGKSLPNASST